MAGSGSPEVAEWASESFFVNAMFCFLPGDGSPERLIVDRCSVKLCYVYDGIWAPDYDTVVPNDKVDLLRFGFICHHNFLGL